ncbi:hypothetical protein TNCV_1908091 [Trichonephila clavipes]|nr:hypothetical protein TNCV_1908091 [Trichonephila clavipes]
MYRPWKKIKQRSIFLHSPKNCLSDSGLEIKLAIPFAPSSEPQDCPQQPQLGEGGNIIHQIKIITDSPSTWVDVCGSRPHPDISRQSEFLHGTHACQCDH